MNHKICFFQLYTLDSEIKNVFHICCLLVFDFPIDFLNNMFLFLADFNSACVIHGCFIIFL